MKIFNRWYDGLKEPKRFLVFLAIASPFIALNAACVLNENPYYMYAFLAWGVFLVLLRWG